MFLMQLNNIKLLFKLNVYNICNLLKITLDNEWKMTFQIREELFESLEMLFEPMNILLYI